MKIWQYFEMQYGAFFHYSEYNILNVLFRNNDHFNIFIQPPVGF